MDVFEFEILNDAVQSVLFQFSGFSAFAVVFGLSLLASLVSLHYLFKNWRNNTSHSVVTGFTVLISAFNIAVFVLRVIAMAKSVANTVCPTPFLDVGLAFGVESMLSVLENPPLQPSPGRTKTGAELSLSLIPTFLWISDAFLLYRAWVIWVHHRKSTLLPALVFLASLVTGSVWLKRAIPDLYDYHGGLSDRTSALEISVDRWVPALGFSCGFDALTTGMIAGRLIYYHRKQKKLTESHSTIYLPVVTIFVESAALSLISKILQLSVESLGTNPIVVPLCTISSNLIVLRKALGADVGQMLAKGNQDLSALHFHRPSRPQRSTNGDSIPGGFEAHLIRTIGGHTIDIGPLEAEDGEQYLPPNVPKV